MNLLKKIIFKGSVFAADPTSWSSRCADGDVATIQGFECLFLNIVRVAATLAGIAFGIMVVVGGFKLIFSGGNPEKTQQASKTLTFAAIGLVATLGAWFGLKLIEEFTGVKVTEFIIPGP